MTIWRMRIACWISKGTRARAATPTHTHTYSEHVIHFAFLRQLWFRERPSMLRYTCTACLVYFSVFLILFLMYNTDFRLQ